MLWREASSALAMERLLWRELRSFPRLAMKARYPPFRDIRNRERLDRLDNPDMAERPLRRCKGGFSQRKRFPPRTIWRTPRQPWR